MSVQDELRRFSADMAYFDAHWPELVGAIPGALGRYL
jgi:hypothetical protein